MPEIGSIGSNYDPDKAYREYLERLEIKNHNENELFKQIELLRTENNSLLIDNIKKLINKL